VQLGCLYRKRNDYMAAASKFTEAANSYAAAFGNSDKRVAEATKRARAMAVKLTERGTGGGKGTGSTAGSAAGGSSSGGVGRSHSLRSDA